MVALLGSALIFAAGAVLFGVVMLHQERLDAGEGGPEPVV